MKPDVYVRTLTACEQDAKAEQQLPLTRAIADFVLRHRAARATRCSLSVGLAFREHMVWQDERCGYCTRVSAQR